MGSNHPYCYILNYVRMKHEIVFFRALLLVFVASLIGFGALAVHYDRKASFWADSMSRKMNEALQARIRCEQALQEGIVQPYSCKMIMEWEEAKNEAQKIIYFFSEKSELFASLALVIPLLCVLAFYGGRWAVSGKVKPLWPFRDSNQL